MRLNRGQILEKAAAVFGIQTVYRNNAGQNQRVTDKAIEGILSAFGADISDSEKLQAFVRDEERRRSSRWLEPVYALWQDKPAVIRFKAGPGVKESDFSFTCRAENNPPFDLDYSFRIAGAGSNRAGELRFKSKFPTGYYHLEISSPAGVHETLLISAPRKCYGAAGSPRQWGVFAPMYALHSEHGLGGGTFTEFERLGEWVAELGGDFAGTLPLTATFLSSPFEPSPYSPASRLFWSEYFIDPARVPEALAHPKAQRLLAKAAEERSSKNGSAAYVNYREEMGHKRRFLSELAAAFFRKPSARRSELDSFVRRRPEALEYARFRAAGEKHESSWHSWPRAACQGKIGKADFRESDLQCHLYAQFIAQEQIDQLLATFRRKGLSLYLDLPVGANSDSYDVWRHKDIFAMTASCGAPPDLFFSEGQDWGFPPLHPQALRDSQYAYWRQMARFQLKHARILRLDHIMGLHRLYWVPHGLSAKNGAYVHYNADDLYAILCVESHLNESVLIGENLGTVPEAVNERMKQHGIRGMHIMQFHHQARQPAVKAPAKDVLTTFDTHDTPTFGSFIQGKDLQLRKELGLLKASQIPAEKKHRDALMRAFARFLRNRKLLKSDAPSNTELLQASLKFLGASKADYALVALEDLWLETNAQNVPGTTDQHPNWQRKTKFSLEQIFCSDDLRGLLHDLSRARHPIRARKREARKARSTKTRRTTRR